MSSKAERKENREPLFVEILEYDNLEIILQKMVVPFSKFERVSNAPDLYSGSENIPFEARDPLYKSAMREEFAKAMRSFRIQNKLLRSLFL
jgi:hypothetical protein